MNPVTLTITIDTPRRKRQVRLPLEDVLPYLRFVRNDEGWVIHGWRIEGRGWGEAGQAMIEAIEIYLAEECGLEPELD